MKFKLPSDTKELLKNPNETLDNVIKMVIQWDTQSMSYQEDNGIQQRDHKQKTLTIMCKMLCLPLQNNTGMDEVCPYCKKPHHKRRTMLAEKIWRRPQGQGQDINTDFEENLQSSRRDPTARRTQTSSRKVMRSTLHTFQGMTIGGNRIENLMDTDRYHQGEKQKQRKCICEATTS